MCLPAECPGVTIIVSPGGGSTMSFVLLETVPNLQVWVRWRHLYERTYEHFPTTPLLFSDDFVAGSNTDKFVIWDFVEFYFFGILLVVVIVDSGFQKLLWF